MAANIIKTVTGRFTEIRAMLIRLFLGDSYRERFGRFFGFFIYERNGLAFFELVREQRFRARGAFSGQLSVGCYQRGQRSYGARRVRIFYGYCADGAGFAYGYDPGVYFAGDRPGLRRVQAVQYELLFRFLVSDGRGQRLVRGRVREYTFGRDMFVRYARDIRPDAFSAVGRLESLVRSLAGCGFLRSQCAFDRERIHRADLHRGGFDLAGNGGRFDHVHLPVGAVQEEPFLVTGHFDDGPSRNRYGLRIGSVRACRPKQREEYR